MPDVTLPRTDWLGDVVVREYGCTACQRYHREGLDPEYDTHRVFEASNGPQRDRPPTVAERFALEMAGP